MRLLISALTPVLLLATPALAAAPAAETLSIAATATVAPTPAAQTTAPPCDRGDGVVIAVAPQDSRANAYHRFDRLPPAGEYLAV